MPKQPVSVTLDQDNLLWLRGRVAGRKRRSLSDALDEVIREARLGGRATGAVRSVAGTIDIAADDPLLERADEYIAAEVRTSLARPFVVREAAAAHARALTPRRRGKTPRRGR